MIRILHHQPLSIDDCAVYPLFTDELLSLMRSLIPPRKQSRIATAIVVKARLRAANAAPT